VIEEGYFERCWLKPDILLATKYHQRWEAKNTMGELKTYLNRRKTPTRSLKQE